MRPRAAARRAISAAENESPLSRSLRHDSCRADQLSVSVLTPVARFRTLPHHFKPHLTVLDQKNSENSQI